MTYSVQDRNDLTHSSGHEAVAFRLARNLRCALGQWIAARMSVHYRAVCRTMDHETGTVDLGL